MLKFRLSALALIVAMLAVMPGHSAALANDRIDELMAALPDVARNVMPRLNSEGRQLLAMRSYLRSERSLAARWSWSEDEIRTYAASDAKKAAVEAVDKVVAAFEAANPGYSLYINTKVRSLDVQVANWNKNASVEKAAGDIAFDVGVWLAQNPKAKSAELKRFIAYWKPARPVAIAAPGMSPHGQGNAFDFQIMKGGAIIAGANTLAVKGIWGAMGWAKKLEDAIDASGAPFLGPLTKPDEPWHYEYRPKGE